MEKMQENNISVIIMATDDVVRRGLKAILVDRGIEKLVFWSNPQKLVKALGQVNPDILLFDGEAKQAGLFSTLQQVKQAFPSLPVLVYSARPEKIFAFHVLKAGAMGYVEKGASEEKLFEAVQLVAQKQIYLSPELNSKMELDKRTPFRSKLNRNLSAREIAVLERLIEGKRNRQVGEELNINEKTVSTYRNRLLRKLNIGSLAELVKYAEELGVK